MSGAAVVSFDCWNTLLTDSAPDAARERQVAAVDAATGGRLGRERAATALDDAVATHADAWRAGRHHGLARIVAGLADALGLDDQARAGLADDLPAIDPAEIVATPGAHETLDALHDAGYRLALACDTGIRPGRLVRGLLDQHGLLDRLDSLAFSDEVGVPKPDARMFEAALQPLDGDPARSAHVGDLVATDVVGARNAGLRAVLFTGITPPEVARGASTVAPDCTIDRLTDLPAVLELA